MTGNRSRHFSGRISGFAWANNILANTCACVFLMTPGLLLLPPWTNNQSSKTDNDWQSLSVFDETRLFFYYLVGPGQPTMQYYSSLERVSVFDQTRLFFYYLVGRTIFIPSLIVVIGPYKFPSFSQPLETRHFLSNPFRPIQDTVQWSLLFIQGWTLLTEYWHPIVHAHIP